MIKAVSRWADTPSMSLNASRDTTSPQSNATVRAAENRAPGFPLSPPSGAAALGAGAVTLPRLYQWLAASRAHRVLCLLFGVWIINAFDTALTVTAHTDGLLEESNPIAARLLLHSPTAVVVYKLALVGFSSVVLVIYRRRFLAELAAGGMLFIYTVVAIQWRLCYEVYALTRTSNFSERALNAIDLTHILRTSWLFEG